MDSYIFDADYLYDDDLYDDLAYEMELDILNSDYNEISDLWDDDWPEPTIQQYEEWDREYQEIVEDAPWIEIDCSNINGNKLKDFINDTNEYNRFDKRFSNHDVVDRIQSYDHIHIFHHNKGYRNSQKHIEGIISKNVDTKVCNVLWKIKNHILYRKSQTFRNAANLYIKELLCLGEYGSTLADLNHLGLYISEDMYIKKLK